MRGDRCAESRSETIDCSGSLIQAIYDAGGLIRVDELMGMTLREFISTVAAQNNIRFIYKKPEEEKPHSPGEGYYFLSEKDTVQLDDEFYSSRWISVNRYDGFLNKFVDSDFAFRRKLPKKDLTFNYQILKIFFSYS